MTNEKDAAPQPRLGGCGLRWHTRRHTKEGGWCGIVQPRQATGQSRGERCPVTAIQHASPGNWTRKPGLKPMAEPAGAVALYWAV